MIPRVVGSRELKVRLGTYLREVRRGATIVVTDRGVPIAQLVPIESGSGSEAVHLAQMRALGFLSREIAGDYGAPHPVESGVVSLTRIIREDRDA